MTVSGSAQDGDPPQPSDRPRRADAQRNRDRLVEMARSAFATTDGTVALEAIARRAGVGIGTLYRHFPTRESLAEAVYAAELDDVTASVDILLARHSSDLALRAWMDGYAEFFATKRGVVDALRAGWARAPAERMATPTTRTRITAAIATILAAGARDGSIRVDVAAEDVTAMVLGVLLSTATAGTPAQTGRLLDLVLDAVRPPLTGR